MHSLKNSELLTNENVEAKTAANEPSFALAGTGQNVAHAQPYTTTRRVGARITPMSPFLQAYEIRRYAVVAGP